MEGYEMNAYDLDTPALIVDLDVLERNIRNMADLCARLGIPLRVHTKTHKTPQIAHMQLAAGSQGIVCQKVGEAEVMVKAGIHDILIPFNIVGRPKVQRLTTLARMATMTVAVDSVDTATGISQVVREDGGTVRILVEVDTGGKRCGVQSPEAALELARSIVDLPGLSLQGIMTYPSMLQSKPFLDKTVSLFHDAALPCHVISGGGTGAEAVSKELGCTEHRSGSYAFEGMTRIHGSQTLGPEHCAMRVLCTVVSVPAADRIIIDGGQKTFEAYPPNPYGLIIEHPQARIYGMSVEHGHVDVSQCDHRFRVGEKVHVIPLHQGKVANMHEEMVGVRNGQVEVIWRVEGRGKIK
jgi:D-serine deaminase-like pyridoxal phosphate-dependent protein